jgi:hypothetical protein
MNVPGTNTGHGHVWPRPDGSRVLCGGIGLCAECRVDSETLSTPVTVLVSAELLASLMEEWSEPVQIKISYSSAHGYELIARRPE